MTTFFTADEHFGHQNIIKYCKRPWKWADEMDEALIENFNSVVTDDDIVYHLGDFCWKKSPDVYLSRLKGREHHLIIGNHDNKQECLKVFNSVNDVKMIQAGKTHIWLSHYAHRVWPRSHYGVLHFFGHSHGTLAVFPQREKLIDVGVDNMGYKPRSIDQLLKLFDPLDFSPI